MQTPDSSRSSTSSNDVSSYDDALESRVFELIAEFAAGAGHELNNPLAVISMLAQNLLVDEEDPNRRWALESILEQTRLGHEMLASLRLFSRPPQPSEELIDARALFQEWTSREREQGTDGAVEITILDELGADALLKSDPAMLTALLSELGRNAREAAAQGGRLLYFLKSAAGGVDGGRSVEIGVANAGLGFDAKAKALAFAPYYSGRRSGRGLGFGLSLARRFAEVLDVRLQYGEEFAGEPMETWRAIVQESSR